MNTTDFLTFEYLSTGNYRQKRCFDLLIRYGILNALKNYSPVVVGTIPIGIDIECSDVDIACYVLDFNAFLTVLNNNFSIYESFFLNYDSYKNIVVCSFIIDNQAIEIFACDIPVEKQNGYRHMVLEYRILKLLGYEFREKIVELKSSGLKTEPAFGRLLGMKSDDIFSELLELENYSDKRILKLYES